PLRAFLIDDDSDDLHIIRRIQFLQDLFRISHLRDSFGRYKRYGINMLEPSPDERAQILDFEICGDLALEALPGITGAFDEFDFTRAHQPLPARWQKLFHRGGAETRSQILS